MQIDADIKQENNLATVPQADGEEHLKAIVRELNLASIVSRLKAVPGLPEDLHTDLMQMVISVFDLFGEDVPTNSTPIEALSHASRDIALGRVLRERGIFRVFLMMHDGSYVGLINPLNGNPFARQEDFVDWFSKTTGVSRALLFLRTAAISRLLTLGFSMEDSYRMIVRKPSAIQETIRELASWEKGELVDINPDTAERLATRLLPADKAKKIAELANNVRELEESPDSFDLAQLDAARDELLGAVKPALAAAVENVANVENAKDAMKLMRHDLAGKPDITYWFDPDRLEVVITEIRTAVDHTGTQYEAGRTTVRLIPDPTMTTAMLQDLVKRIPFSNRGTIPLT